MSRFSKIIKQVISAKYATRPSQDLIMCISCWTTTMSKFFPLESTYNDTERILRTICYHISLVLSWVSWRVRIFQQSTIVTLFGGCMILTGNAYLLIIEKFGQYHKDQVSQAF